MKNYKGANLLGKDFRNADLAEADFRGANLQEANFTGACLNRAQFRGADVQAASFIDADLSDADLVGVRNADAAIWPDGFPLRERLTPTPQTPQTEHERLLKFYFGSNGRLAEIPVGQTRQRVVMEHIVNAFEPNVRYPEKQLNDLLKQFHADFATLRRYLIDHRLMARENNVYWRV